MSLRHAFTEEMKTAAKAGDKERLSTIRLIIARMKERDIESRDLTQGPDAGVPDSELIAMLQSMIKQRHQSIEMYEKGNRPELAQKEKDEIQVIQSFLPQPLTGSELEKAIHDSIQKTGATSPKDMAKVIECLKACHPGRIDFGKATPVIKGLLG